jgi:preprotein translocase subunit SecE
MAKQTRAQRRARRAERERQGNGADATAIQRQAPVRASRAEPAAVEGERRLPGSGVRRFIGESAAELRKVEWPGQQQLIQGTAVVLIACIIVGTYLWVADLAFKRLVQHVFLGQ